MAHADLITNKSNIRYLSNFDGSSGFMLLTNTKKYLFTDFRYIERAKNIIKKGITLIDITRVWRNPEELKKHWHSTLKKHKITSLGIEEDDLTIARFKRYKKMSRGTKIKYTDISGKFAEIREIKSKEEIKLITKSQQINEKVFLEIKEEILSWSNKSAIWRKKNPLYEIDLAYKIKELGNKYGAEDVSFDPIVAFGKNSAIPHHSPGKTKLNKDDIVLIDMGMKYKGYCSDMTRTFFTGKISAEQEKVYNLVLEAQLNAVNNIKAGITGSKADALSRDIIKKAGYGEFYGHAGGHGVGLDIHESPALSEKYNKKFRENIVVTVEPGIYLAGKFGVRIEDMVLVQKKGVKNLTKPSKKLLQ